jgi:hypothetical protein
MVDFNKLKVGDKIFSKQDREKIIYTIIKKYGTLLDLEWSRKDIIFDSATERYIGYACPDRTWEDVWEYAEINWQERIREGREL